MISPAALCQIEIAVSDLEQAKSFYENAFGWTAAPAELYELVVLDVPKDCPYGVSLLPRGNASKLDSGIVLYFAVENPEAIVERVKNAGGSLRMGPKDVTPFGRIWLVADPDGNKFGLFFKNITRP